MGIKQWLTNRMSAAKESAEEFGQLLAWVGKRNDHTKVDYRKDPRFRDMLSKSKKTPVTADELRQFFSWLNARMHEARLDDHERTQLDHWIKDRLISTHPELIRESETED